MIPTQSLDNLLFTWLLILSSVVVLLIYWLWSLSRHVRDLSRFLNRLYSEQLGKPLP